MLQKEVTIIGGGLAGCEAAYQLAKRKIAVRLYEMRPHRTTEAHQSHKLAELVCSNSFKNQALDSGPGILKAEMRLLDSLALRCAEHAKVDAGQALAVDREVFADAMSTAIQHNPYITIIREEVKKIPIAPDSLTILATGPLTSLSLADSIRALTGEEHFYFYDAIAPIVDADTINRDIVFRANRWDKPSENNPNGDYLNCPLNKEEYQRFIEELATAEKVETKNFERLKHFEGCMPIESMLERGQDTLRFGPMRPVGLRDPRTGKRPWAVVQLRSENAAENAYNMVGFQTKLKYPEQKRIFRLIPGLENVEFYRLGSMHRNSFINSPEQLNSDLSFRANANVLAAGQLTGVEGYMESTAIGLLAGIFASQRILYNEVKQPPRASALGALLNHLQNTKTDEFQPMGINFSLFNDEWYEHALAPLRQKFPKKLPKQQKRALFGEESLRNCRRYTADLANQAGGKSNNSDEQSGSFSSPENSTTAALKTTREADADADADANVNANLETSSTEQEKFPQDPGFSYIPSELRKNIPTPKNSPPTP